MQGNTSVTGEDGEPCKNGERLWFNFSTTIKCLESDSKAGEREAWSRESWSFWGVCAVLLFALEPVLGQQTLTRACLRRGFMFPSKLGVIPTLVLVLLITWDHSLVFWLFRKRKHERKAYFLFLFCILVWTGCVLEAWVFPPLFHPQRSFHFEINNLCESAPWTNWFQTVVFQTWQWLPLSIPEDANPAEGESVQQQQQIKD